MERGSELMRTTEWDQKCFSTQKHRIVLAQTKSGVLGCDGSKERLGYFGMMFCFIPVSGSHTRK